MRGEDPEESRPAAGRLLRLRDALPGKELDGLLVSHPPNVGYLSGFHGSAGFLVVRLDAALLLVDSRYREQAREEVASDIEIRLAEDGLVEGLSAALEGADGGTRMGFEAHRTTVRAARKLEEGAAGVEWVPAEDLVEELRAVKDAGEIRRLARAAEIGTGVLGGVLERVEEGVTEVELAAELDYRLRRAGSGPPAFESIVAAGPRSALPHARPTRRRLREGDLVLFDFGATVEGYCADMTRTAVLGPAAPWQREAHEAVRAARDAAVVAVEPGREAREVDREARAVLETRGTEGAYRHSTGHGIGLEVHEKPSLSSKSDEILREGNVVTIEPGVYLRGRGGIRLEDDVVVGGEEPVLTDFRRDLPEL